MWPCHSDTAPVTRAGPSIADELSRKMLQVWLKSDSDAPSTYLSISILNVPLIPPSLSQLDRGTPDHPDLTGLCLRVAGSGRQEGDELFLWSRPLNSLNLVPDAFPAESVAVACPSPSPAQRLLSSRINQCGVLGLKSKSSVLTPAKYPLSGVDSWFLYRGCQTLGY